MESLGTTMQIRRNHFANYSRNTENVQYITNTGVFTVAVKEEQFMMCMRFMLMFTLGSSLDVVLFIVQGTAASPCC